jgi:hypothetical protein
MSVDAPSRARDRSPLRFRRVVSEPMVGAPAALPRSATPRFRTAQLRPQGRAWPAARQGWLGFAGVIVTGALLALSVARTSLLLPESVRPLPSSLAGAFGQGGIDLGLGGLIAVLTLMFLAYALMVRGAHQLTARTVLIGIGCLNLLVLLAPPMLSTDMFSYIAYGRIGAVYGSNPYLFGPSAIALDPLYPFIGSQWIHTPTAYGPLFTILSYLLAPLTIAANVIVYKMIAAISSLVVVWAVWGSARLRGLNPVKAVAIVGLNPVIVVFGVGGGHNDLLMLAILVSGVYALLQHKQRASGGLIVAAAAVKLTAVTMLPFALAQSAREHSGQVHRRALLTGAGVAAGVVATFALAVFGTGPVHLLGTLQSVQSQGGVHSIPGLLLTVAGQKDLTSDVGLGFDAILLASLVWLVRRVWLGRLDWIAGAGWATVAMLVTAGLLVPWYVGWLVPLAALSRDRRLLGVSVVLTGLGLTTL